MKDFLNKEKLLKEMTFLEKVKFISGSGPMNNFGVPRLNIPPLAFNDGPMGLRRLNESGDSLGGISDTFKSTVFPCASLLSATWNEKLIEKVGIAIGEECNYYGTNVLLGPAINIKRNPLCGRNFEYYSEDPFLAGKIAAGFIKGVESKGVSTCVKHYAVNNNETYRFIGDNTLDLKALNEIYLKPFDIVLNETNVGCFMSAYNKVNHIPCSEHPYLLLDYLRNKHKFNGLIMTDWGGTNDRLISLKHSLDLEMPGNNVFNINRVSYALKNGELDELTLNTSVERLIDLYNRTLYVDKGEVEQSIFEKHYELSVKCAEEGIVLLKNEGILPLNKDKKYLIVGDFFQNIRYQGSGSSLLNPYYFISPNEYFDKAKVSYDYFKGYDQFDETNDKYLKELKTSKIDSAKYEAIIYFVGQNDFIESEGFDRDTLDLAKIQLEVLDVLKQFNLPIVLLFNSGSAITLPFIDKVDAILNIHLGGAGISKALYNILFGLTSPSGRLSETFIKKYEDVAFHEDFLNKVNQYYKESIFVGYRYYDTYNVSVNYPFGFGLSYTKFEYKNFNVNYSNNILKIDVDVSNVGDMSSKEVVQIYVGKKTSKFIQPKKELKAFKKVSIKKGEYEHVSLSIPLDDLKVFDVFSNKWVLENATYIICLAKNVEEVIASKEIIISNGEEVKENQKVIEMYKNILKIDDKTYCSVFNLTYAAEPIFARPYNMDTPIYALNTTMGKIIRKAIISVGKKQIKKAKKIKDPVERNRKIKAGVFVSKLMPLNSFKTMSFSSAGLLPYHLAKGLMLLSDNHILKGLKEIMRKEKIEGVQ